MLSSNFSLQVEQYFMRKLVYNEAGRSQYRLRKQTDRSYKLRLTGVLNPLAHAGGTGLMTRDEVCYRYIRSAYSATMRSLLKAGTSVWIARFIMATHCRGTLF